MVLALLFAGADAKLKDARGFDAVIEAARGGHSEVIGVLARSGARTGISNVLQVCDCHTCVCVGGGMVFLDV